MSLEWTRERIRRSGFIAILRGDNPDELISQGFQLAEVGVKVLEVTLDSTDAARVFNELRSRLDDDIMLGVGTVMHPESALPEVAKWGADFALSPVCPPHFVEIAHELNILAIPGAGTPDEMWKAHLSGAMIVKLYPASTNWSPEMIYGLPTPFKLIDMLPTGGISASEVDGWIEAGASACGLGSNLTIEDADLLTSRMIRRRGFLK